MARALEQQTRMGISADAATIEHIETAFTAVQKMLLNLS
jgi:hypothetical protein